MSQKIAKLKGKPAPLNKKEAVLSRKIELLTELDCLEEEEEENEGDIFLCWIDRFITVTFHDGSILEGYFRKYSKGTLLLDSLDSEALVFVSNIKFMTVKNALNPIHRGGELS